MGWQFWIITTLISLLIALLSWGGSFVISILRSMSTSMQQMSTEMAVLNELNKENAKDIDECKNKITGTNANVIDLHDRLLVIETEHKLRKCK